MSDPTPRHNIRLAGQSADLTQAWRYSSGITVAWCEVCGRIRTASDSPWSAAKVHREKTGHRVGVTMISDFALEGEEPKE